MAWTQADLDKLDAAISGGAVLQSIAFADQTFVFRSVAEMIQVRALIAQSLNATAGTATTYRLAASSKGV
jgi:hypothetical protein